MQNMKYEILPRQRYRQFMWFTHCHPLSTDQDGTAKHVHVSEISTVRVMCDLESLKRQCYRQF